MSKNLIIPSVFLSAILIKSLIVAPGMADSLMFAASIGLFGFLFYLDSKKEKPVNEDVKNKVIEIEETSKKRIAEIEAKYSEKLAEIDRDTKEIKSFLNTTKMINPINFGMKR